MKAFVQVASDVGTQCMSQKFYKHRQITAKSVTVHRLHNILVANCPNIELI